MAIFFASLMDVMGVTIAISNSASDHPTYNSKALIVFTDAYTCVKIIATPLINKLGDHKGKDMLLIKIC